MTVTTAISATETESSEQNKLLSDFPVHKQEEVEKFDIFVSYCHRDMEIAVKIVDLITTSMPGCKIFFDMNNLTVGNTWQQKLYRSIGRFYLFLFIFRSFFGWKIRLVPKIKDLIFCKKYYFLFHMAI